MRLGTLSDTVWWGNAGSHNYMFIATPEAHGISPIKPQTHFYALHPPVRVLHDLRVSHTSSHVWKRALPGLCRLEEKEDQLWAMAPRSCSASLRQRLLGSQAGGGELALPFSSCPTLPFAFSWDRGRVAHRLMLFAQRSIMHDTIHNLLSFVYHLQRINNVILASCFFSICHCCVSNSVNEDWLVQFCTYVMRSIFEQMVKPFFSLFILLQCLLDQFAALWANDVTLDYSKFSESFL